MNDYNGKLISKKEAQEKLDSFDIVNIENYSDKNKSILKEFIDKKQELTPKKEPAKKQTKKSDESSVQDKPAPKKRKPRTQTRKTTEKDLVD